MKFKCKMTDVGSMRDFTNVANTVARMSKQCIIRLTQNSIYINVADDSIPMIWTKLDKNHFFVDYLVVGKSKEFNEIYMELNTGMLAKSVISLKATAKSVKIKLTNKQQPCLTFNIELSSLSTDSRLCVHDVPVTIIPQKKWSEYNEPNIKEYDISLEMPEFKQLRSVMERIKNMSSILILSASKNGILAFKADTNIATITVHFPNLAVFEYSANNDIVSANLNIKKLYAFLAWEAVHPTSIKCNILNDKVININLNLENHLQIKYYIPSILI